MGKPRWNTARSSKAARLALVGTALLAIASALVGPARAAARIADCPLRSAPFSVDLPVMDIVASPAARAAAAEIAPTLLTRLPAGLMKPTAPNFSALITLRSLDALGPRDPAGLAALDRALRRIPVSETDRAQRCARYDPAPVALQLAADKPIILIFERMTGYRDKPAVEAARTAITDIAARHGWNVIVTEQAGAIAPEVLRRISALVWNNVSGDVLTLTQRRALRRYVEHGGGFFATHGAGGDID